MKTWIEFISSGEVELLKQKTILELSLHDLSFSIIEKHRRIFCEETHAILLEINLKVTLFKSSTHHAITLVESENQHIYINDFFYYTLIGRTLAELKCFIFYLHISLKNELPDLQIDIHQKSMDFKKSRIKQLSPKELAILDIESEEKKLNLMALTYVNILFKNSFEEISSLEKKVIRDTLGTSQAKKLLGLDESAYKYIENGVIPHSQEYVLYHDTFHTIQQEIEKKKIFFEDFAHNYLKDKNMLLWTSWTISPFVAADLSILLPMLSEAKTIKTIYIDLCHVSQPIFEDYLNDKIDDEKVIENEIKRIYPPILENYQKETLPYMILLEKIKMLSLSIKCFGFDGIDLIGKEPFINHKNQLEYPLDHTWKRYLFEEYQKLSDYQEDEMIIFFQFLKPMGAIPSNLRDSRIEKIIHTDQFTGYGPEKPENSLSIFSRFSSSTNRSFVLPEIKKSSIKDETIVFFPYMDDITLPRLDDSHFNRFRCYDSLIYSSYSGGGSHREIETPSPAIFKPSYS